MDSVDTGTLIPSHSRYITELLEPGTKPHTVPIPGRLSAVPPPAISESRRHSTAATESGQPLPERIADPQAAEAVELHALRFADSEHGVRHESVIAEHGVIESPSHPDSVEPRTKTVGDVLRHAALIIEERGWCPAGNWEDEAGRVCMVGAIGLADSGESSASFGTEAREFLRQWFSDRSVPSPITFNDTPGRTAAEVIAALRAAADEAER